MDRSEHWPRPPAGPLTPYPRTLGDPPCLPPLFAQEDLALLRELHVSHYRFSLSWPRLLPTGVRGETGQPLPSPGRVPFGHAGFAGTPQGAEEGEQPRTWLLQQQPSQDLQAAGHLCGPSDLESGRLGAPSGQREATGPRSTAFGKATARFISPSADKVNEMGIKFYSDFIDALLKSNITPIVTLHHWDLPQVRPGGGRGLCSAGGTWLGDRACQGRQRLRSGPRDGREPRNLTHLDGCRADFTDVCNR